MSICVLPKKQKCHSLLHMFAMTVYFSARTKVVYVTKYNIKGITCVYMCLCESHMYSGILVNNRRSKIGDGGYKLCVREAL